MFPPFRSLTPRERELIEKLLEPEFPGRDELLQQLGAVTARQIHDDGTLELHCEGGPQAPVTCSVPTEGEYQDADGRQVNVLLHVKEGLMWELEILKLYPSEVRNPPQAGNLVVFAHHPERWP
jgi:hypothetical protein